MYRLNQHIYELLQKNRYVSTSGSPGAYYDPLPSTDSAPDVINTYEEMTKDRDVTELDTKEWKEIKRAHFVHVVWIFKPPKSMFNQKIISAWMITGLVFALTIAGLVFS